MAGIEDKRKGAEVTGDREEEKGAEATNQLEATCVETQKKVVNIHVLMSCSTAEERLEKLPAFLVSATPEEVFLVALVESDPRILSQLEDFLLGSKYEEGLLEKSKEYKGISDELLERVNKANREISRLGAQMIALVMVVLANAFHLSHSQSDEILLFNCINFLEQIDKLEEEDKEVKLLRQQFLDNLLNDIRHMLESSDLDEISYTQRLRNVYNFEIGIFEQMFKSEARARMKKVVEEGLKALDQEEEEIRTQKRKKRKVPLDEYYENTLFTWKGYLMDVDDSSDLEKMLSKYLRFVQKDKLVSAHKQYKKLARILHPDAAEHGTQLDNLFKLINNFHEGVKERVRYE